MWSGTKHLSKRICLIFWVLLPALTLSAQDVPTIRYDYRTIFGEKYTDAEIFVKNNDWFIPMISSAGVDSVFAISMVFPELIRYSAIRDQVEIQSLKVLYVQFGENYSDFSVGPFQMKPSFAENIEKDFELLSSHNDLNDFKDLYHIKTADFKTRPGEDPVEARKARIHRLTDRDWQVKYLLMFIKIMEKTAPPEYLKDLPDKLKYFATAYNCGYWKNPETILSEMTKKRFHTSLFETPDKYNYSDISWYFYQKTHPTPLY